MASILAAVSGGFAPLHKGHVELIEAASQYGKVIILLNSDDFLLKKKGFIAQPYEDREYVLRSLKLVSDVFPVVDTDLTVCETLRLYKPHFFVNGGDRNSEQTIPEAEVCAELGISLIFTGQPKVDSSSAILERMRGTLQ